MFAMLQFAILAFVALILFRLLERVGESGPDKPQEQPANPDPSDAEVVPEGGEYKPVNRIKKYRF